MKTPRKSTTSKENSKGIIRYNLEGVAGTEIVPSKSILDTSAPQSLTAQYIRTYSINQRQGNAMAKSRAEVSGTTKKIYKQKGTGKARHGSMKAPIFKGGGVVGGPRSKEYSLSFNKQQKKQVLLSAFNSRIKDGSVIALETDLTGFKTKTKTIADFLKKINPQRKSVLFIIPHGKTETFVLALRNIKKVISTHSTNVNAYQILSAGKIVLLNDALNEFEKHFIK